VPRIHIYPPPLYRPWSTCPSFSSPLFSSPSVSTLQLHPSFSSPANSTHPGQWPIRGGQTWICSSLIPLLSSVTNAMDTCRLYVLWSTVACTHTQLIWQGPVYVGFQDRHGPWPMWKRFSSDHDWRGRSKLAGCRTVRSVVDHRGQQPLCRYCSYVDRCHVCMPVGRRYV